MKNHNLRKVIFKIIRFIITPFFKIKFNYSCDRIDDKGPYVLVCNHVTNYDPILLGIAEKNFVYFVATENVTRMGFLSKIIKFCFNPIIHYKGKMGINTVKEMLTYLKAGYNVGIFPEGNRSFNGVTNKFITTIGKVVKKSGASLITYRLDGGYFTQPRWGTSLRKGKMLGTKVHNYSPEELSLMSDDCVNESIEKDIYVDAYADQVKLKQPYKGKNPALGLESCLFLCPSCKRINTLKSDSTYLSCDCGYSAIYDNFGYIGGKTITELDLNQHDFIINNEVSFEDKVTAEIIDSNHSVSDRFECKLSADSNGIYLNDELISITGLEIHSRNTLIVHAENKLYNFKGSIGFNALKYKYIYEKI